MKYYDLPTRYERTKDKAGWKIHSPGEGVIWSIIASRPGVLNDKKFIIYTLYDVKNKKQIKNIIDSRLRSSMLDSHKFITHIKQMFNTNLTFDYEYEALLPDQLYIFSDIMRKKSVLTNENLFNRCEEQLEDNWCEWFTIGVFEDRLNTPLYHHIGFKNKEDKLRFILLM